MKIRETPYRIVPTHMGTGATAPAMYIYADSYDQALKRAKEASTLYKRFPNKWMLI